MGGEVVADVERDVLKLAVVERHLASGRVGVGFVRGLGLRRGALASTVAHDSHNIIVAGADDADMLAAVEAVCRMGGGLAAVAGAELLAAVPLPIAGLMSPQPLDAVARQLHALIGVAHDLGASVADPFMALSFLALPVIPALKLTDRGLVDVQRFKHVSLFVH